MGKYDYHKRAIGDHYYGTRSKKKSRVWRIFIFCLFFTLLLALFLYVFPEVEVTIVPKTEAKINDLNIIVDANFTKDDLANNKVLGKIITAEDSLSKTFNATGQKNMGDKAQGEIVLYNQTGLVQPLTTENSLVSDGGIIFFLTESTEIPKAEVSAEGTIIYGTSVMRIVAKEAGEAGNINPGRLTIIDLPFSKQNKIYAEVKTMLTSGTSKIIKVVSEDDLEKAEENIKKSLEPNLKKRIKDRLTEMQVLYDGLVKFDVVSVEKAVELEEEIENFTIKVIMKAEALIWDESEVRRAIINKIESEIGKDKRIVTTSRDVFEVGVESFDLEKATANLKIHAENQVSMPIDINEIKDKLRGLTESSSRRLLLERIDIKDVYFKFNYSITNKIPNNGNRINVKLNFR